MTVQTRAPSLFSASSATLIALIDFYVCFLMVSTSSSRAYIQGAVLAEIALIAFAVVEWVRYFHSYVDYKIKKHPECAPADRPRD